MCDKIITRIIYLSPIEFILYAVSQGLGPGLVGGVWFYYHLGGGGGALTPAIRPGPRPSRVWFYLYKAWAQA